METENRFCIAATAATVNALLGMPQRADMAAPLPQVLQMAQQTFGAPRCDRVFLYHPDAVALWMYEKYRADFAAVEQRAVLTVPLQSVFPPVTPVCFASMYSGLMPAQHGIQKYEKPVLSVETVFDDAVNSHKRAAIVSTAGDSISKIFLNRDIDYFIYKTKQECNAKALELIQPDAHDLIVLYNGDYDHAMHRFGPEGSRSLRALRENIATFAQLYDALAAAWGSHDAVLAFAPDHGCHKWLGILGAHGIDAPCDMQIAHFYSFLPKRT